MKNLSGDKEKPLFRRGKRKRRENLERREGGKGVQREPATAKLGPPDPSPEMKKAKEGTEEKGY